MTGKRDPAQGFVGDRRRLSKWSKRRRRNSNLETCLLTANEKKSCAISRLIKGSAKNGCEEKQLWGDVIEGMKLLVAAHQRGTVGLEQVKEIQQALQEGWIKPQKLRDDKVARLQTEAEAIPLALELSADLIVLEESDGRRAAERAGVLLRTRNDGQIQFIKPDVEALRTQARFFLSARLEQKALEIAGE